MIYIFSSPLDESTSDVIEWLGHFNKKHKRINDILNNDNGLTLIIPNDVNLENAINSDDSVWYRKMGHFGILNQPEITDYFKDETERLTEYINSVCKSKNIIGSFYHNTNKLKILNQALKHGIRIPETIITNSKKQLIKFHQKWGEIIIKPISEVIAIEKNKKNFGTYATLVNGSLIKKLPESFRATQFQRYIEKEYELRIFYLKSRLYPMAIFSQNNKRTAVDFRKYDSKRPNRTIPCKLPNQLEAKLINFLKEEKLEASSVDMVKCKNDGEYYFLEVNPWGQYGMVSLPCNYYLDKRIAEAL